MLATQSPFSQYFDKDGDPLDGGSIYFGVANQNPETNPITVYWDLAGTQPAAQPVRTVNGYTARAGTPANIYVPADYSITLRNRRGEIVFYVASSAAFSNDQALQNQINNVTTAAGPGTGADIVPFSPVQAHTPGSVGQHIAVEWNPQDFPWLAKFDGATDDTVAIQACLTAIYNAGGGVMRLPRGTTRITSIAQTFNTSISVLIRGAGRQATIFKKLGSSATPMISLTASLGVLDVYSELSDFTIDGLNKSGHGVQATTIATIKTDSLGIINCDTCFNSLGCLVSQHINPSWTNSSNRGYACAASSGIYPNLVNFFGGKVNGNTTWNVDITHGAGIHFYGTDLSGGGTAGDLNTGILHIATTVAAEVGISNISFKGTWFENGNGQPIKVDAAGGLHLTFDTTFHLGSQAGRVMNVGAIGSITILNPLAGSPGDTITIGAAGASTIIGGSVNIVVDSSVQQFRSGISGALASPGTVTKNLQIQSGGSFRLDPTVFISDTGSSFVQGNVIAQLKDGAGAGGAINFYAANGGGGNAAATVLKLTANSSTSRSINAGGTVNVGGADYAEYETKRVDCGPIAKGDIIGFDTQGLLTDRFDLAITFGIKSTAPSYVGGDVWGTEEALGEKMPDPPRFEAPIYSGPDFPSPAAADDEVAMAVWTAAVAEHEDAQRQHAADVAAAQEQFDTVTVPAYHAAVAAFEALVEAARQKVDRIAYSGKVPVNLLGTGPGDWIVPVRRDDGGIAAAVGSSADAVGRVRTILEDGRALVVVRAA